jgi:hypothetical protein
MHYLMMGDVLKDISSMAFYLASAMRRNDLIANIDRANF